MDKNKKVFFLGDRPKNRNLFEKEDLHPEPVSETYYANEKDIQEKLEEANTRFEELTSKIESLEEKTQTMMSSELSKVRQQIDESKTKIVETLAVFAALFTFLSLQVQVLKEQTSLDSVIGLVLVSGGMITFFVLILDVMIKNKSEATNGLMQLRFILLFIISVSLIGCGILFMTVKES